VRAPELDTGVVRRPRSEYILPLDEAGSQSWRGAWKERRKI
jgi:hypothetical protein